MIETLEKLDQQLFLFLNGIHSPFWDTVMYWISDKYFWFPFYAVLIGIIIYKERKKSIPILIAIAVLITLADQLSVHLFKEVFERFRPCRPESPIHEMVHIVNNHCGGQYGFISSHAANSFAAATFLAGILRKYFRGFTTFILVWAAVVSYSRIYLGVHYPGDILGGAVFGIILGIFILFLLKQAQKLIYRTKL